MSALRICSSLLAASVLVAFAGSAQANAIYRINVGGPAVASIDAGIGWAEDSGSNPSSLRTAGDNGLYNTGSAGSTGIVTTGPAGVPLDLFQTERWDAPAGSEMTWAFAVPVGSYEVRVYLAEIYNGITGAGQRSFDVSLEGSVPAGLTGLDPYALAGNQSSVGVVVSSTLVVSDGTLDMVFVHGVENPAVKAIEIVAVPEPTTALLLAGGLFALGRRARHGRA